MPAKDGWPFGHLPIDDQIALDDEGKLFIDARDDFGLFVEVLGKDHEGNPVRFRALDDFMWQYAVEAWAAGAPVCLMIPTGFGKTNQVQWRVAWELGRNPQLVVPFVTESYEESAKRVDAVREIMQLKLYHRVFPDVRFRKGKDRQGEFELVRGNVQEKEPTVQSKGVLTGTGVRSDLTVFDDVVTHKNAVQEPANRDRIYHAIRTVWMQRARMSGSRRTRVLWIQTTYHGQDASARLRNDTSARWWFLIVRAEPPFDALTYEKWIRGQLVEEGEIECPYPAGQLMDQWMDAGPRAANLTFANRPIDPESCPFQEELLEGPRPLEPEAYETRTVYADPAGDASTSKSRDTDYCAMTAIGRHTERGWEVYGFRRLRGKPSEQAVAIADFAIAMEAEQLWQEAVRDDALVEATQHALEDRGSPLTVQPDKPATNKETRIVQALEPALIRRRLSVCGPAFPELQSEMVAFPGGSHDDGVDAVASCWLKAAGAIAEGDADHVVSLAVLHVAAAVTPEISDGVHIGVAIAGYETDESAAVVVRDRVVVDVVRWPGMDVEEAVSQIAELRENHAGRGEEGELVPVPEDQVHVAGVAVVDHLIDEELEIDGIDLAGDPDGEWEDDLDGMQPCKDRRSELWWVVRQLLRCGLLQVSPRYVDLWSDLSTPTYEWDAQGRIKVKAREKFRREKERAPMLGDALAVAMGRAVGSGLV